MEKILIIAIGLFLSLSAGVLGTTTDSCFRRIDCFFFDLFVQLTKSPLPTTETIIVDIDDISLDAVGQWPWPRYKFAALIETIASQQPTIIGLDILFSEPDRTSLNSLVEAFRTDFGLDISFSGIPSGLTDNDGYLGHVLSGSKVIGANFLYFDHQGADKQSLPSVRLTGSIGGLELPEASGILDNIAPVRVGLHSQGFINTTLDADGLLRQAPLLIKYKGTVLTHLALATLLAKEDVQEIEVGADFYGPLLKIGSSTIPIDRKGYALLRFPSPSHTHKFISAVDVLNGSVPFDTFTGKTVFVGSSAAGMNDLHHTIFHPYFPGVEVHAVVLDNFIQQSFARMPSWSDLAVLTCLFLCSGIVIMIFTANLAVRFLALSFSVLTVFLFACHFFLFANSGIFLSPGLPLLVCGLQFSIFSFIRFVTARHRLLLNLRELNRVQQLTLESMATVAETRDPETGGHIQRTQHYVRILARGLRDSGKHTAILTDQYIELLYISSPLHDIGKVGVPDRILLKQGKLNAEEFQEMQRHCQYGYDIIHRAATKIEGNAFFSLAKEIAMTHHEKWDGSGYPNRLRGEAIPLSGRIMAVADVYDALISARCYKPPFSHAEAMEILEKGSGSHFDPEIIQVFKTTEQEMQAIARSFSDHSEFCKKLP